MSSMGRILALAIVLTLAPAVAHGQNRFPAPGADPVIGRQIFTNTCGFCHQDGGRVAGRGPKLAGTFFDVQMRSLIAYIRSLKDDGK